MSNSKLVDYTLISPNSTNPRNNKIKKITIHHMAGNLSVETCGREFQKKERKASSNYGIGSDGRIGLYVAEKNRAWTSGNAENDHQAITIEVANDNLKTWHVSDKALNKLIDLCVDICQRNGIERLNFTGDRSGNLTMHKYFQNTNCPGPYLESKFKYIADEVNKRLKNTETVNSQLPYLVKVNASVLNVRSGAGMGCKIRGTVKYGEVFTIVETWDGWGKLKSGAGWICLKYTTRID